MAIKIVVALFFSLPFTFGTLFIARKWAKVEGAKFGKTFLLVFCWLLTYILVSPMWKSLFSLSLDPFVWFCYWGVDLVMMGLILFPLGKFFWRTSWRKAGIVSGITTGNLLFLLGVLYLATPRLIALMSASGTRNEDDQVAGPNLAGLSGLLSMFGELAKSSGVDSRVATSEGMQRGVAETQSDAATLLAVASAIKTSAEAQRKSEEDRLMERVPPVASVVMPVVPVVSAEMVEVEGGRWWVDPKGNQMKVPSIKTEDREGKVSMITYTLKYSKNESQTPLWLWFLFYPNLKDRDAISPPCRRDSQ